MGITIFIFSSILMGIFIVHIMHVKDCKKKNTENKRSSILFNSIQLERNVPPEEVFKTLKEARIKPAFLEDKSNK